MFSLSETKYNNISCNICLVEERPGHQLNCSVLPSRSIVRKLQVRVGMKKRPSNSHSGQQTDLITPRVWFHFLPVQKMSSDFQTCSRRSSVVVGLGAAQPAWYPARVVCAYFICLQEEMQFRSEDCWEPCESPIAKQGWLRGSFTVLSSVTLITG